QAGESIGVTMKGVCWWTLLLLCTLIAGADTYIPSPIAMDWHRGGYLYIAFETGDVDAYEDQGRVVRIFHAPGFRPAEIVSAKVHGVEVILISGFRGREGSIVVWDGASGRQIESFATPELAAGLDIDPGTTGPKHAHVLYIASAVSSSV